MHCNNNTGTDCIPGNYTVGITFSMQLPLRLLDHVCVTHGEVWECVYCATNNPSMGTNPRTVKRKTFWNFNQIRFVSELKVICSNYSLLKNYFWRSNLFLNFFFTVPKTSCFNCTHKAVWRVLCTLQEKLEQNIVWSQFFGPLLIKSAL